MGKKICYDITRRVGNEFESQLFTVNDFLNIIQSSFYDWEQYRMLLARKFVPMDNDQIKALRQIFLDYPLKIHNPDGTLARKLVKDTFKNEDINVGYAAIFSHRVFNLNNAKKIMFDFYINKRSNFLLDKKKIDGSVICHENANIEEGMLIIRCYNYRKDIPDYVDINSRIHVDAGLVDLQMRSIPWVMDEWINNYSLRLENTGYVYLMSPLLRHCLVIYDKILLLSKQKSGFLRPKLLRNAIEVSFNDARIVAGMNNKYKTINSLFIRVVPSLKVKTSKGIQQFSRFHNPLSGEDLDNAYSYSDVISNGSGKDGKNKITTDHYSDALKAMDIKDIIFTKEENTNNGLFAWINSNFVPLVNKVGMNRDASLRNLNNHMIALDTNNNEYVTALYGEIDFRSMSKKETTKRSKKANQRIKHSNSRTFKFDLNDQVTANNYRDLPGTPYTIFRHVNYLNNEKDPNAENDYSSNALVAFIDSDIHIPTIKEAVNMSQQEFNDWLFSLRGISCEGFFSAEFLSQSMVVPRTKRLKCYLDETDLYFVELIKSPDLFLNKRFHKNDFIEIDNNGVKSKRSIFQVREYLSCICGGKIYKSICKSCNNPKPLNGEIKTEKWVDFFKDFEYVTPTGVKFTEDGIDINLNYSIKLANSRLKCDELTKAVPVETRVKDIGFIKHLRCGDIDIDNVHIPLDGSYFGLGGFKSSVNGIPFTALRLYNALTNKINFSSEDCVKNTVLVNEFLKNFKKSIVHTQMYDPETKSYVYKDVEAWVGLVAISPTEVSQEFNKSKGEENRNLSKANYALNNLLGYDRLNKEYSKMNINFIKRDVSYSSYEEIMKIAKIYSSVFPLDVVTDSENHTIPVIAKARNDQQNLLKDIRNLTNEFILNPNLFDTQKYEKINFKQYITYNKYKEIIETHPLFTNPLFEHGFYVKAELRGEDQGDLKRDHGYPFKHVLRAMYIPRKEVLLNMFEIVADNNVRISDLLAAFFGVFESLSVSKIVQNVLCQKNNESAIQTYNMLMSSVLKAVDSELFDKEGLINQMTNIAVTRMMSKQLTCIHTPMDVAIVSNNREYKEVVTRILKLRYPEKTDEDFLKGWEVTKDDSGNVVAGWCWLEDVYCQATRQPLLFSKQNLNIKKIWSSYKADQEYLKLYGVSFSHKHPRTKGIYLYSSDAVAKLEGDTDGDIIFLVVPETCEAQNAMAEILPLIENMKMFDINNKDETAVNIRDTYLVPTVEYLIDEASNLNFKLDELKIGYSKLSFKEMFDANFDASKNKENVGFLTVSLWYITYFLDFYIYNFEYFKGKYNVPEITKKNKYEILFIFQYLLAQQNGVRAMKDTGFYGKLTYDVLIKDKPLAEGQLNPRDMLRELINEYTQNSLEEGIQVDFSESLEKLFLIFNNMFISSKPKRGFGFSRNVDSEVFSYKDNEWSKEATSDSNKYDCSDLYDDLFLDFEGSFILINGRNYKTFIDKFGFSNLIKSLSFKYKSHLHNPLLSYYHDIFNK